MLSRSGVIACALAALAPPAAGQEIVNPTWATVPDGEAMAEVYPEFASMISLEGDVNVSCRATREGILALCRVNTAVPTGLGFEEAALALTPRFRVNPREIDGDAAKSDVRFTIRFRMEPDEAPLPWKGPEPSPEHLAEAARVFEAMIAPRVAAAGFDAATRELNVGPDRASRVRAMVLQVEAEFSDRKQQATALAMARILTPEQLAGIRAGGRWPARPSDEQLASAGDEIHRVDEARYARLRQLYCAEFECLERTPAPVPSF